MTTDKFAAPAATDYNDFYRRYVSLVPEEDDFCSCLETQIVTLENLLGDLPEGSDLLPHPPYTWTLRQLVGHLIDCERIFSGRLLHIGVGDPAELPGMDQDVYVANLDYSQVTMRRLLDEFAHLRRANLALANRMSVECLNRVGQASGWPISARANLYIMVGHVEYHVAIIKKRLGK